MSYKTEITQWYTEVVFFFDKMRYCSRGFEVSCVGTAVHFFATLAMGRKNVSQYSRNFYLSNLLALVLLDNHFIS